MKRKASLNFFFYFDNLTMNLLKLLLISFLFWSFSHSLAGQNLYFPPLVGADWETIDPTTLNWCQQGIDSLYDFLDGKGTKGFIILKDGKIVLEKYFKSFTKDSVWYWASAGKTMTSFLTGMAQEKGLLSIHDKTSKYLGAGWTSMPSIDEQKITLWHQLTMTTGLNDDVNDDNCMQPSCLTYKSDAGTRWAYHNAPYRLLHDVIGKASGTTIQNFMTTNLSSKTGIYGLWSDGVLYSKPRSMARFGLLVLSGGIWNGKPILNDQTYISAMTTPSQSINKSYGLLWWLNGQSSFMLPNSQIVFPGQLIPNAPAKTWCALGKNDQKIYIIPDENIVIIRMGNDGGQVTGALSSFDNQLWEKINGLSCKTATESASELIFNVYPNPSTTFPNISIDSNFEISKVELYDSNGQLLITAFDLSSFPKREYQSLCSGMYLLKLTSIQGQILTKKLIKNGLN